MMRKILKPVISILLALLFGWLAIKDVSFNLFVESILKIDWLLCLLAVPLYVISLYIRSMRWSYLLKPLAKIKSSSLFGYSMVGMLINNIIPARAGELYRSYLCSKRHGVKYSSALAIVLIDRILDCIILVGFLMSVMLIGNFDSPIVSQILIYSALLFFTIIVILILAAFYPLKTLQLSKNFLQILPEKLSARLTPFAEQFIEGVKTLGSLKRITLSLGTSLVAWIIEACFYWLMFIAMGFTADISWALLAIPVISFILLIPTVPANIGVYHFGLVTSLALFQVDQSSALATAVIIHSGELLVEIGLGVFYVIILNLKNTAIAKSDL